ncbi:DNA N-6-adenine-methyltransferase [Rhizobium sp. S152]|uniref:DNA N-6-adenine-methyltransferase n=1 Tax=Rhizobium sp. S152 TaxID=3055038 RepID=UPI00301445E1
MGHWETAGRSDEWYTPHKVFEALGVTFDVDVAAPNGVRTFVPASDFITEESLERDWSGFVWMNPPFGGRNALKHGWTSSFATGMELPWCPTAPAHPGFGMHGTRLISRCLLQS